MVRISRGISREASSSSSTLNGEVDEDPTDERAPRPGVRDIKDIFGTAMRSLVS